MIEDVDQSTIFIGTPALEIQRKAGVRSVQSVPLVSRSGKTVGMLSTHYRTPHQPDEHMFRLFDLLAGEAADIIEHGQVVEALRLSEAAARRAAQTRDELLGIVAHDLRNPLQIITINAGFLRRSGPEPVKEMAEEAADAANRMNRLIQDLLDVTSIESGHLSVKPERLHVFDIFSELLEMQTPIAKSASLELWGSAAPDLPDIWADRDRILQAFENLIGNAIKFTKPRGHITLGAVASTDEVVLSVSDTGSGIKDSDLPHVFDRFWQASHGAHKGAGLGLAIVKGIVEAHCGRIWVHSTAGQGTTFFFTIPTVSRPRQRPTDAQPARATPETDRAYAMTPDAQPRLIH